MRHSEQSEESFKYIGQQSFKNLNLRKTEQYPHYNVYLYKLVLNFMNIKLTEYVKFGVPKVIV